MSSYLSDFEHHKIHAHVFPDFVVETHIVSDPNTGARRVPVSKAWRIERVLGKGSYGEVRLEVNEETNENRAVKRIWTSGSKLKKDYERELKALLEFSKGKYKEAAVFVGFLGWFEDHQSVHFAMEYVPLGDLENNVPPKPGVMKEIEIRDITQQILEGLKIMHLESFVHRDLKPQNVLVCHGSPNWWVKLADFGLSKRREEGTAYRTFTGTQSYMAPEVMNYIAGVDAKSSEYTEAVDMWALGCIVFWLASGVVPFPPGPSLYRFCKDTRNFPTDPLALSTSGCAFVKNLLVPHPPSRLSAEEALNHTWMKINLPEVLDGSIPDDNLSHIDSQADKLSHIESQADNLSHIERTPSDFGYNTGTHQAFVSMERSISSLRPQMMVDDSSALFTHPTLRESDDKAPKEIKLPLIPKVTSENERYTADMKNAAEYQLPTAGEKAKLPASLPPADLPVMTNLAVWASLDPTPSSQRICLPEPQSGISTSSLDTAYSTIHIGLRAENEDQNRKSSTPWDQKSQAKTPNVRQEQWKDARLFHRQSGLKAQKIDDSDSKLADNLMTGIDEKTEEHKIFKSKVREAKELAERKREITKQEIENTKKELDQATDDNYKLLAAFLQTIMEKEEDDRRIREENLARAREELEKQEADIQRAHIKLQQTWQLQQPQQSMYQPYQQQSWLPRLPKQPKFQWPE